MTLPWTADYRNVCMNVSIGTSIIALLQQFHIPHCSSLEACPSLSCGWLHRRQGRQWKILTTPGLLRLAGDLQETIVKNKYITSSCQRLIPAHTAPRECFYG